MLTVTAQDSPAKKSAEDTPAQKGSPAAENGAAATNSTTICYLEKQDCTIAVKAGPNGTVYSVKKANGKTLCENVTLDQLRAQAPELHQFIKSALALSDKNADARLDVRR